MALLEIDGLKVEFFTEEGVVKAVNGVNLKLDRGESLAIVGESGSGKSVLALAIPRLLPVNARISGRILFNGRDVLRMSEEELRKLRGRKIALIPQNPGSSLNPVLTVGYQLKEAISLLNGSRRKALKDAVELLRRLRLPEPERFMKLYPHMLSGGMKQRVLISLGIAGNPELIVADEPTKNLDSMVRAEILELLKEIGRTTAMLFITHDIQAAKICDRVAVMYAGEVVETGSAKEVLSRPAHPYTTGLVSSLPENGLIPIPGSSPGMTSLPEGCSFYPRCSRAEESCSKKKPELRRGVRCFYA